MESGVMDQTPFIISESFPIPADKMFDLWTSPEHLGQWFGPAGVKIVRQTMDLRVGGAYHFCLQTLDGPLMWGKWVFREITAPKRLAWIHAFSDEAGGLSRHPMSPTWPLELLSTVDFQEEGGGMTPMTRITLQ
jgi:uncharacterized protein YndB with AHSA1/START domain